MRIVIMLKNSTQELKRMVHPNAVILVRLNKMAVAESVVTNVLAFITFYGIIAVISMGILRLFRESNILENNIVQTAASAGESLAAGVIFTLPAMVRLGAWTEFNFLETTLIAGFGGGAKILVPGVAGRATIGHNHALHTTPETIDGVGRTAEDSPMRLDLEEAAAMLAPPVFVVDAVLNGGLGVVRIVSGHSVDAHREGMRTSRRIFAVPLDAPVDVVITDSHPMDQDLRQGMKAVGNAIRAVRKGGVLVALIRAEEGVGEVGLAGGRRRLGRRALTALAPLLVRLVPRLRLGGMGEEDRFFLYFALQAMRRATLLLYAPTVPDDVRAGLPFAEFVDSPEAAIVRARMLVGDTAHAVVFPDGGATYPELGP